MILVDSSVWIKAWRGKNIRIKESLSDQIERGEVVINYLIQTELLQGAQDERHQRKLEELLSAVPLLPLPEKLWKETPRLYLNMRKKGLVMTTIDCLIASHALLSSYTLWSLDRVFEKIPNLNLLK